MNQLKIIKICYFGENYHFESPKLDKKINIITGANSAGKSTFIDLIYYAIGGTVNHFKSDNREQHKQIVEDKNNYVECLIEINQQQYKLTRHFNIKDSNIIIVVQIDTNQSESYYLSHNNHEKNFSDWMLEQLNIESVDLVQGASTFKLGFNDLMRLIYYNQISDSKYILKPPDGQSNFFNDSNEIRKTIFEILTSEVSPQYYNLLNVLKEDKAKLDVQKNLIDYLHAAYQDMDEEFDNENTLSLHKDIKSLYAALNVTKRKIKYIKQEFTARTSQVTKDLKRDLEKKYAKKLNIEEKIDNLNKELIDFFMLKKIQENEVRDIELILSSHEFLGFGESNHCPICGTYLDRELGKCLCGADIDENQYTNYFYTENDHKHILGVKKTALETTMRTIRYLENTIPKLEKSLDECNKKVQESRKALLGSSANTVHEDLVTQMESFNDELFNIKKKLDRKERLYKSVEDYENQLREYEMLQRGRIKDEEDFRILQIKHQRAMSAVVYKFSDIYNEFLKESNKEIKQATIDMDYEPVINDNSYTNTASKVHRRLFYYISLLKYSLIQDIPFPRLLLIDTPQNFGIDIENLKLIFKVIAQFIHDKDSLDYQIILTIKKDFIEGIPGFDPVYNIVDDDKLLIKNEMPDTLS